MGGFGGPAQRNTQILTWETVSRRSGFEMGFRWVSDGFQMVFRRVSVGFEKHFRMGFQRISDGFHIDFRCPDTRQMRCTDGPTKPTQNCYARLAGEGLLDSARAR